MRVRNCPIPARDGLNTGATYHDFTEVIVWAFVAPEHVHRYRRLGSRDLMPPEGRNVEPKERTAYTSHACVAVLHIIKQRSHNTHGTGYSRFHMISHESHHSQNACGILHTLEDTWSVLCKTCTSAAIDTGFNCNHQIPWLWNCWPNVTLQWGR